MGVEAWRAQEKKEPKCDFDDPYTVFAWFFKHPGVPQGPFLVPFSSLFGFKGVRHSGFLALTWLWPKIGVPRVVLFSSFFAPLGVKVQRAKEKNEPKCDVDDPYTVFAWFSLHPGVSQGPFLGFFFLSFCSHKGD